MQHLVHSLVDSLVCIFLQAVFVCLCLKISVSVSGHGSERVPREGPAGGVPHQGQQGPGGVPAGDGAGQREPHRRAGRRLTQPFQEVSTQQEKVIHPLMIPSLKTCRHATVVLFVL